MKRRKFIQTAGQAIALPIALKGFPVSAIPYSPLFSPSEPTDNKVLVIIQLNGGNDGLNMLFPTDRYDKLFRVRGNILIDSNQILPLTNTLGIHPEMEAMQSMFKEGNLGVIQSVGYPNQNRSHFRSMDIWQTGSPANQDWNTGWLGRYFEKMAAGFPQGYPNAAYPDPFAITMGSSVSLTCQGEISNFSLTLNDPNALVQLTEGIGSQVPDSPYGRELDFLRTSIAQSNAYSSSITTAAKKGTNLASYPTTNALATQLKNIALLISGGLTTKVYVAQMGGFDTHANQVDSSDRTQGSHADLLKQLSEAVAAFQRDLHLLGVEKRVIGITFSEFGRQIASNASAGTDHGSAAPLLLFGQCVKKPVVGDNPLIADSLTPQEGVAMQFDFRDIYGSLLVDWFGVDQSDIRSLLYAGFTYIPLLNNCALTTSTEEAYFKDISLTLYPNPTADTATLSFESPGGSIRVSLFNSLGSELLVWSYPEQSNGLTTVNMNLHMLPAGNYSVRVQGRNFVKTSLLIKVLD